MPLGEPETVLEEAEESWIASQLKASADIIKTKKERERTTYWLAKEHFPRPNITTVLVNRENNSFKPKEISHVLFVFLMTFFLRIRKSKSQVKKQVWVWTTSDSDCSL